MEVFIYHLIFIFLFLLSPLTAFAYLDPGTSSMILQAIVAVFAGAAFFVKSNWNKIKGYLSRNKKNKSDEANEVEPQQKDEIDKAS